jgi:hypothetical protein
MTDFDAKKALVEEIQGLNDVKRAYTKLVSKFEQEVAEAEVNLNATKQIAGFVQAEIERKQGVLRQIIAMEKMKEGK